MVDVIVDVSMAFMLAAGLLGSLRFFIGPSVFDRVIALDVLTIITISVIAFVAHHAGRRIYLDIAVVYGLLSFIAVLAIARYMERRL